MGLKGEGVNFVSNKTQKEDGLFWPPITTFLGTIFLLIVWYLALSGINLLLSILMTIGLSITSISLGIWEYKKPESLVKNETPITLLIGSIFFLSMVILLWIFSIFSELSLIEWTLVIGATMATIPLPVAFLYIRRDLLNQNN